jgi:hypothetical protein
VKAQLRAEPVLGDTPGGDANTSRQPGRPESGGNAASDRASLHQRRSATNG